MQQSRLVAVDSPFGGDAVVFRRLEGREELGRPFEYRVDLLSEDPELRFEEALGRPLSVRMALPDDGTRYFHGLVTDFTQLPGEGRFHAYRVTLRPWLWFLTRAADCRIFPDRAAGHPAEMTAPQIVAELFREFGFTDFRDALSGEYRPREFCVQYRETAFDFVSRLLEEEGIYYWFAHEADKHTLVLADGYGSHERVPGYEEVRFRPPQANDAREEDTIHAWHVAKRIQTGRITLNDFDFERPKSSLVVTAAAPGGQAQSRYEVYDYPGGYRESAPDGEAYARARVEALSSEYERARGRGNVRGFHAGALFRLADHTREDQNREYLLTAVTHRLEGHDYASSGGAGASGGVDYEADFEVGAAAQPYRPLRRTPRARVEGPQTATVVGKAGEKVWTDKYGRVKVQFHWDRCGQQDENSSCWVRVSQNWAGKQWGGMFLPHVGQEVIVEFLEGDPDRPIVTGRVYNALHMPPKALPDGRFQSVLRDDYGNEMIFDASPGDEHIRIHSPHHTSTIELGKSITYTTTSDEKEYTVGDSWSTKYGDTTVTQYGHYHSNFYGEKTSIFVGMEAGAWVGGSAGFTFGAKLSGAIAVCVDVGLGAKYSFFKGNEYSYSQSFAKSVNRNVVLDANDTFQAIGGGHDNTIINADTKQLVLEIGEGDKSDVDKPVKTSLKYFATAAAGFVGAYGGALALDERGAEKAKEAHRQSQRTALAQPEIDALEREYRDADAAHPNAQAEASNARNEATRLRAEADAAEGAWQSLQGDPDADPQAVADAEADFNAKDAAASRAESEADAREATWADIQTKKAEWQEEKAVAEASQGQDMEMTGVGLGTLGVMGLGVLGVSAKAAWAAYKNRASLPATKLVGRKTDARVTLNGDGVWIEVFNRAANPVGTIRMDEKGNVSIAANGKFEVNAGDDIHLRSDKDVVLSGKTLKQVFTKIETNATTGMLPPGPPPMPPKKPKKSF